MPDLSAIAALLTSFKAASEITKGMAELKTQTEIQSKVIELQGVIMGAQASALTAQFDLTEAIDEIAQLNQRIADMEGWEATKAKYLLTEVAQKIFVYASNCEGGSLPTYWLCPNCFEDKRKSIIQLESEDNGLSKYFCPKCAFKFHTGKWSPPPIQRRQAYY